MLGLFKRKQPTPPTQQRRHTPNPYGNLNPLQVRSAFTSDISGQYLSGWTTESHSIDYYLATELVSLRARSRELVRRNPFGKRFITAIKSNVVGPQGVRPQAQVTIDRRAGPQPDKDANELIEKLFKDWCKKDNCDYTGRYSFLDFQNMAISNAAQDGEFIFRVWQAGKYGFQIQSIDPDTLDTTLNRATKNGEIRLGVEYNSEGRIVRYYFRNKHMLTGTNTEERYSLPAKDIIHGFINEWPDQSRGIPWMHASLERSKSLDKYDEAAMIAARVGASKMAFISRKPDEDYTGEDEGEGGTSGELKPGSFEDIGESTVETFDPTYPHQMYDAFCKQTLRAISSGIGVSYHSISNDLEGVNYSSIRAGVLEDREIFKGLQTWFVDQFVQPVYERFIYEVYAMRLLKLPSGLNLSRPVETYYAAHFQPRRWAWVDPQKDGTANNLAIENRTKSRSQIIREQGDDPDSLWQEIARENELLENLNLKPAAVAASPEPAEETDEDDEDEENTNKD